MVITLHGVHGALQPSTNGDAIALASTLVGEGWDVRINGLEVRLEYRAGYDILIWAEGAFNGQPVPGACSTRVNG